MAAWVLIAAIVGFQTGTNMSAKLLDVAEFARLSAAAVQLSIPVEFEAGVVGNLERLFELAAPLQAFVLEDDVEPAPVFQP